MTQEYSVKGMTCHGCAQGVTKKLSSVYGVQEVEVDLENGLAKIHSERPLLLADLKAALPEKYSIESKALNNKDLPVQENQTMNETKSKLQQLKPLLLIFTYLFTTAILLNYKNWNTAEAMLDFMGLFYIVFSFFKFLDLKGFPESFKMYDPLAKAIPAYGWIYPFLELALGLLFLMRFQVKIALIVTIIILGITTFGVTKTLLDKKSIRCACLGTALKLPMTEATFIENTIMLVMSGFMLFS